MLRESEERFRLLVESVQDYAIFMLDPEGHVVSWNVGAERIKGYRADEVLGRHFSIFYPPEDAKSGQPDRVLERALAEGRFQSEGWRVRKDGSRFWAHATITVLFDAAGQHRGFAKVTRDMTESKQAEEQRRQLFAEQMARREAEALNRAKDEFVSIAAHELKTPVTTIKAHAQLLARRAAEDGNARTLRALDILNRQCDRLVRLVDTLLDVSQISVGRLKLHHEPVALAELAAEVTERTRPLSSKHRLLLTCTTPAVAYADPDRIDQVLTNLLTNAIKFSPGGGDVEVRVMSGEGEAVVSVKDPGIGIPQDRQQFVFERLYRAHTDGPHSYQGMGLGLYISREIVSRHGGRIWFDSEEGNGTTFYFSLPLVATNADG